MASWETAASGGAWARGGRAAHRAWAPPDARRRLQLGLAAVWLLDGVLQYQPVMFTRAFSQLLAATAAGNPAVVADPISWAAGVVAHYPVPTNAAFATIQVALGLGIAWRRSVRLALAASVAWSLAVWWFGEGLGGVLTGDASPLAGAPGPVILYALLAVLLWPPRDGGPVPFAAAGAVGTRVARAVWVVLWGSMAGLTLLPASRTAQAPHDLIARLAAGEPGWLAAFDRGVAGLVAHRGLLASVVLAVLFAAIAGGILRPVAVRATLVLAIVVTAVVWVVGQDLGGILVSGATDVGSGPLLILLALAYWPARPPRAPDPGTAT